MRILIILNLLVCSMVSCGKPPARATPDKSPHKETELYNQQALLPNCNSREESAFVQKLNAVRLAMKAPLADCLPKLSHLAQSRSQYINQNPDSALSHFEEKGRKGFRGRTLRERGNSLGIDEFNYWLSEGLGGGEHWQEVLHAHLNSVYHRSPLLTPSLKYAAYAQQVISSMASIDIVNLQPALFPSPDAVIDDVEFLPSLETPNPWPEKIKTGIPISVHFPKIYHSRNMAQNNSEKVSVDTFVVELENQEIEGKILSYANDPEVPKSDVFFIPSEPLERGKAYKVSVKLHYGENNFSKQWHFEAKL